MQSRKSTKPSGVRSHWPREEPTLFLDRSLGKHIIADRLRQEKIKVEVHDDHLPNTAPDEEWIALVGERGWVALTKDKRIRYRRAEIRSVLANAARLIVIQINNVKASEIAEVLVRSRRRIARFTAKREPPFVAAIYRDGRIRDYSIE